MLTIFWTLSLRRPEIPSFIFPPERLNQIAPADWNSEFTSLLLKKIVSLKQRIPDFRCGRILPKKSMPSATRHVNKEPDDQKYTIMNWHFPVFGSCHKKYMTSVVPLRITSAT